MGNQGSWGPSFGRAYRGAGLVEYGLVTGLISVLAIGAVLSNGERVRYVFCLAANTIGEEVSAVRGESFTPLSGCALGAPGSTTGGGGSGSGGTDGDPGREDFTPPTSQGLYTSRSVYHETDGLDLHVVGYTGETVTLTVDKETEAGSWSQTVSITQSPQVVTLNLSDVDDPAADYPTLGQYRIELTGGSQNQTRRVRNISGDMMLSAFPNPDSGSDRRFFDTTFSGAANDYTSNLVTLESQNAVAFVGYAAAGPSVYVLDQDSMDVVDATTVSTTGGRVKGIATSGNRILLNNSQVLEFDGSSLTFTQPVTSSGAYVSGDGPIATGGGYVFHGNPNANTEGRVSIGFASDNSLVGEVDGRDTLGVAENFGAALATHGDRLFVAAAAETTTLPTFDPDYGVNYARVYDTSLDLSFSPNRTPILDFEIAYADPDDIQVDLSANHYVVKAGPRVYVYDTTGTERSYSPILVPNGQRPAGFQLNNDLDPIVVEGDTLYIAHGEEYGVMQYDLTDGSRGSDILFSNQYADDPAEYDRSGRSLTRATDGSFFMSYVPHDFGLNSGGYWGGVDIRAIKRFE